MGGRLAALYVVLSFSSGLFKKLLADRNGLGDRLVDLPSLLVLAKKLFAYEEHSYTEPIALNVLVMALAGAYLLAILNWIATERHSGTVAIPVLGLVFAQSLLDDPDHLRLGEELVRPALHVSLRELYGALYGLVFAYLTWHGLTIIQRGRYSGADGPKRILAWVSHDMVWKVVA